MDVIKINHFLKVCVSFTFWSRVRAITEHQFCNKSTQSPLKSSQRSWNYFRHLALHTHQPDKCDK